MTSAARSAPSAAISTAALRRPPIRTAGSRAPAPSPGLDVSDAGGSWMAIRPASRSSVLLHPAAQLLGYAVGVGLGELLHLTADRIARPAGAGRGGHQRGRFIDGPWRDFAFELRQPDGQL